MINIVFIQAQDFTGRWIDYGTSPNDPRIILLRMQQAAQVFGTRARAIDETGRLIDQISA